MAKELSSAGQHREVGGALGPTAADRGQPPVRPNPEAASRRPPVVQRGIDPLTLRMMAGRQTGGRTPDTGDTQGRVEPSTSGARHRDTSNISGREYPPIRRTPPSLEQKIAARERFWDQQTPEHRAGILEHARDLAYKEDRERTRQKEAQQKGHEKQLETTKKLRQAALKREANKRNAKQNAQQPQGAKDKPSSV